MKSYRFIFSFTIVLYCFNSTSLKANQPDSAYIFAYSDVGNSSRNGLYLAWSINEKDWYPIGPEHTFVYCDYGSWGSQKKMHTPFLFRDKNNKWHCLWNLNNNDDVYAYTTSKDLVLWKPQEYPTALTGNNCLEPEISFDEKNEDYTISWKSDKNGKTEYYSYSTKDFRQFSETRQIPPNKRLNRRKEIEIKDKKYPGTINKVSWDELDFLIKAQKLAAFSNQQKGEDYRSDDLRFRNQKPVDIKISADVNNSKKISDMLMGVFFEDINYAADGGLYAELVQNRGFEYNLKEKLGSDKTWISTKAWSLTDSNNSKLTIDTVSPLHINNKHYAVLEINKVGAGLANKGFAGIYLKEGDMYDFSLFIKNMEKSDINLLVRLVDEMGQVCGKTTVISRSSEWIKVEAVISAEKSMDNGYLEIIPQSVGRVALDMISLFPQKTFMGRKNGLRADLAQVIADLQPKFLRFPGGCVVHGNGIENIYKWKNTIGPLEERKSQPNIWGYHQSFGLGFFEYFQFCEDIGAEAIPIIAAGVPCQNSSYGGAGQQGGVPMCDMNAFVQDVIDLIEYCNGDANTVWGKKRAEAGHPEPFNLKYIGIGNEDLISDIFKERFAMIYKAISEKYPEITVIGTVGPFYEGSDYEEGWKFATELGISIVDEHYYESPGWFINNQDFYDRYDRNKSKVYLGEYASWGNVLYNALAEAIYLASLERNADVVMMASYAPLLAKEKFSQWNTDLIFFNNTEIKPTPNYEIQKLFGQNSGDRYINSLVEVSDKNPAVHKRISVSIVEDSKTGDIIVKLVNLLPVEARTSLIMNNLNGFSKAAKTVLTGNPGDDKSVPATTEMKVGEELDVVLLPYSFTLIRLLR